MRIFTKPYGFFYRFDSLEELFECYLVNGIGFFPTFWIVWNLIPCGLFKFISDIKVEQINSKWIKFIEIEEISKQK